MNRKNNLTYKLIFHYFINKVNVAISKLHLIETVLDHIISINRKRVTYFKTFLNIK